MSLQNINWNGKSNNAPPAPNGQGILGGGPITINVPTIAASGAAPQNVTYQITLNGSTTFTIPTAPKSKAEIEKEKADAFDRAMGIVG